MKQIKLYLFISLLTLSFISCSKDDNGGSGDASLIGRWNFSKMEMNAHVIEEGADLHIDVTATNDDNSIYGVFHEDGTMSGQNGVMQAEMVVTGSINMTQTISISNSLPVNGTWERDGNLITFKEGNEENTYEIQTLNATTLILHADQDTANFPLDEMMGEGMESFSITVTMKR